MVALAQAYEQAPPGRCPHLTQQELAVLRLVADGKGNKEVARLLGISQWTVKTYMETMMLKFGVRTRTELAVRAYLAGLLRMGD